jgi:RHS repeat-associated protein
VWAGNSGTQPAAGNGTCGSGTLSSGLTGASYSNSYVYTHLGQLYQGPLNGGSTQEQYLYCGSSSSAPHQLLGLYPTSSGATCANYTSKTADYSSSYDAFGNVTSRSTGGTTGTLSYNLLDQLTKWFVSTTNQEQYVYDSSGTRILRRSTNSTGTTMTVYAFGLEEHVYSGAGVNQGNTYYYSLVGRLIGAKDANGTVFYMTDTLGSILASFTNAAGGATLKGNQVYGPYGNARYSKGSITTAKGFTGQYSDALTGLDYYNARYYDPVAGVFLSADVKQGNRQGMNPYAYVGGNPETQNDPTGERTVPVCFPMGCSDSSPTLPPTHPCTLRDCTVVVSNTTYFITDLTNLINRQNS